MEPKIGVVGLGGVGGFLAGMLIRTYGQVSVVARGARRGAIEERGLVLCSDRMGESVGRPARIVGKASELGVMDLLIVSVKNYSLEEAISQMQPAIGPDTVILPVMNGIDPCDRIRAGLGGGIVVKALIYIVSFAGEDYAIHQQGNPLNLVYGLEDPSLKEARALELVEEVLSKAEIPHERAQDISYAIWKKFLTNCCLNVATAYYDSPIGPIRADQEKAACYEALAREAWAVARARGVGLTEKDLEGVIGPFYREYRDDVSSSLQRDMHAGRPAEVETFSGYIVREGERLGVSVPVSERFYEGLRSRMAKEPAKEERWYR